MTAATSPNHRVTASGADRVRSAMLSGQSSTNATRPASDSDSVGMVRNRLEPDSTNRPGSGWASTSALMARTSWSPPSCTSSMMRGKGPDVAKVAGSSRAADRV